METTVLSAMTIVLVLVAGQCVQYVLSYLQARALASDAPAPVAVAYVTSAPTPCPLPRRP